MTHAVENQPPLLCPYNVFEASPLLSETLDAFAAAGARRRLNELGVLAGSAKAIGWGFDANRNPPALKTSTASDIASTKSNIIRHTMR